VGSWRCTDLEMSVANQGCQRVYFQTQNPNLGKFWRALYWKMLIYFFGVCNILLTFGIFMIIWYIFWVWYHVQRKIWQPWSLSNRLQLHRQRAVLEWVFNPTEKIRA
jgi:hypothetical protein